MADRFHEISAKGARLVLDLAVGHVRAFEVEQAGKRIAPLHTAPWVDDPAVAGDPDILPNLKYLSGDFFCAPFGKSDVEAGSPVSHGWPANSSWSFVGEDARGPVKTARFELDRRVFGARLVKEITLRDGHPFAYERHIFHGGEGATSVASHAMTRFDRPGRLSFSAKAFGDLPDTQSEPDPSLGRSRFARGVRFSDLSRMPLADGTTADLSRCPVADRHEDFVMLVEAQAAGLGWTAAVRPGVGDIMLSLKNPRDFPVTFLWYSNGGRDYPPWNGRHIGVLGIEEGRAWSGYGHAASIAPNPLSRAGIPTSITLVPGGSVAVSHVIGGLRLPQGWAKVTSVTAGQGALRLTGDAAGELSVPFDTTFLAG